jgi:hypothetical protein
MEWKLSWTKAKYVSTPFGRVYCKGAARIAISQVGHHSRIQRCAIEVGDVIRRWREAVGHAAQNKRNDCD